LHTLLDLMLADHGPGLAGSLTQREKGLLDRALYETYRLAGITPDPTTHTRPAPLLRDLYGVLRGTDFREQDATGLADRLHRWVEGSLARLFSAPTNVRLDSLFVVFNIRDMDAELKPIGLALITDTVWTRMRRERGRLPRLLFIDEAWTLMQFPEGGRFLSALARRARKYYLGLVTITQDVQDFLGSEWGQTVLAQSAIKLLM
jgi:type IV secretory pathway VirB4 component